MATDSEIDPVDLKRMRSLAIRRSSGVARLERNLVPGIPVDADPRELGTGAVRLGDLLDESLVAVQSERSQFFDTVSDRWDALFPGLPARPGRFSEGRVILYVKSASLNFALRPKLAHVKKVLSELPGAPKRLNVRVEIRV